MTGWDFLNENLGMIINAVVFIVILAAIFLPEIIEAWKDK